MDKMHPYLRITLGSLIISPLVWFFFALDHSFVWATIYTIGMYAVLLSLSFILYNYLDSGKFIKHAHSHDKPIVSDYVSFYSRNIIYECRCGHRKAFLVTVPDDTPFPIPTDDLSGKDAFNRILAGEKFTRIGRIVFVSMKPAKSI